MEFRTHLAKSYTSASDYVRGFAPSIGVPEVLKGPPNTPQAWAWEARVCSSTGLAERLALESIYWNLNDRKRFSAWLRDSAALDDSKAESIHAWALAHSRICKESESPAWLAGAEMIERLGG